MNNIIDNVSPKLTKNNLIYFSFQYYKFNNIIDNVSPIIKLSKQRKCKIMEKEIAMCLHLILI